MIAPFAAKYPRINAYRGLSTNDSIDVLENQVPIFSAVCVDRRNDEYTHGSMIHAMTSTYELVKYLDVS